MSLVNTHLQNSLKMSSYVHIGSSFTSVTGLLSTTKKTASKSGC